MLNFSRENTGSVAKWWRNVDKQILFLFIILFILGLFISFSSTSSGAAEKINNVRIDKKIKPKTVKIIILNPETKIIVIQDEINNKLCPKSGWLIKSDITKNNIKKENKYLL